jgi:molybdenum cofactor cytidylyltransferase
MKCGALILAAGTSARLGFPKQLVRFWGETLLERSIRIAKEAACAPVVVVLGAYEDQIRKQCRLQDVLVISNPDWARGMGTSLSRGVREFENVPGILVMTCDMPAVTPDHLRMLAASGAVTASSYSGRTGVPAYFPTDLFPSLLTVTGDGGAKDLLRSAHRIDLHDGEFDVDTTEDLAQAQTLFG